MLSSKWDRFQRDSKGQFPKVFIYTPRKISPLVPFQNHPIEKENYLNQTCIFRFNMYIFRSVDKFSNTIGSCSIYPFRASWKLGRFANSKTNFSYEIPSFCTNPQTNQLYKPGGGKLTVSKIGGHDVFFFCICNPGYGRQMNVDRSEARIVFRNNLCQAESNHKKIPFGTRFFHGVNFPPRNQQRTGLQTAAVSLPTSPIHCKYSSFPRDLRHQPHGWGLL